MVQRTTPRVALIHATPVAMAPVQAAFAADWPEAEITNLLDDSLSADLAKIGSLDEAMIGRFHELGEYVRRNGAEAILFTCSAFGEAIASVARKLSPLPVLKPNEAMFDEAIRIGGKVGLLGTFEPSMPSMAREFAASVAATESDATLEMACVPEAMIALRNGDADHHNLLVAEAALSLRDCNVIMLAQFSTAQAAQEAARRVSVPILTSPASAVSRLKQYSATS